MPYSPELDHLAARWADAPDGTAFAALADGLRKAGALAEAEAVALVGLERHPALIPGLLALARIRDAQGDRAAAEVALHRALGQDPSHPVVLEALADLAAASGHPDSAMAWSAVQAAAAEGPDADRGVVPVEDPFGAEEGSADAEWLAGALWGEDEGEPLPDDAPELVTESLARLYQHQGHLDRAAAAFRTLADRHPDHPVYAQQADALERELVARRPRPYAATESGGVALGAWLAGVAAALPPAPVQEPGFDAFFEPPLPAVRDTADFAAFQDWLRGLGR
jgi:tetratricopeptide (TPR) repeat protein